MFRKVRGILNKLTPEKFHKLRKELLQVGLDSTHILKGVILLIFDKALDEPKYSCMYASLCRQLCDESPNFEPPPSSSTSSQTTTFRRLLLTKCQDEFENRRRASEAYEHRHGPLSPEEQEQRLVAKHKMLGNIKFIGELGKQGLLQESILHQCVQQLLLGGGGRPGGDCWQDLECLCQILVTVGRRLDTPKAKPLMDQYFERMRTLAQSPELPARIRFLLRDVVELRGNRWVPRRGNAEHGPRTLQQIREEASRDLGIYSGGHSRMSGGGGGQNRGASLGGGMDDVFAPLPMASLGTGPGVIPSDRFFPYRGGNASGRSSLNAGGGGFLGGGGGSNYYNGRNSQPPPQQFGRGQRGGEHLPPRFLKKQGPGSADEISLRPAQNSMVLKPKTPLSFSKTTGTTTTPLGPHPLAKQAMKEPPIVIKQVVQDKNRANRSAPDREKGATREEVIARVDELLASLKLSNGTATTTTTDQQGTAATITNSAVNNNGTATPPPPTTGGGGSDNGLPDETSRAFEALKIPRKFLADALAHAMLATLDKPQAELLPHMALAYKKDGAAAYLEALQEVFGRMAALEVERPLVKSMVAGHVARGVAKGLVSLSELAQALPQGQHYPLFLLVLQQLARVQGRVWLTQGLQQAKVDLESLLPEGGNRGPERLAEVLEDRGLGFLLPRLQGDLWRQLKADPSPTALYRWLRDSLDAQQQAQPSFVHALVTCLLRHILGHTTMPHLLLNTNSTAGGGATNNEAANTDNEQQSAAIQPPSSAAAAAAAVVPERAQLDKEREMVERFQPLLRAFLGERPALQLAALYALQSLCHSLGFPKGLLLRWFVLLYDLEIVEEEAFLKWKEDVNDDYPGKGKALFQVNQWLTWLEEAEEEEEEDDEDCSDEGDN